MNSHTTSLLPRGAEFRGSLALLFLLGACSSGGDDADPGGGGGSGGSGALGSSGAAGGSAGGTSGGSSGAGSRLSGNFLVKLVPEASQTGTPAFTSFIGELFDAPSARNLIFNVALQQGDCKLLVPEAPFCSPACGSSAVCTAANECTPNPKPYDAGELTVTGLGGSELKLQPLADVFVYQTVSVLPNPPCPEGEAFGIQADSFTAQAKCIAPLTLGGPDPIPVMSGSAVPLSWTAPGKEGISRIHIYLDVAHHGGKTGEINCDVADTGSFTIPEPLITALLRLGLAGFPDIRVSRYSSATAPEAPGVKLEMNSSIARAVDTGVESCHVDDDCTGGKTCSLARRICQ